MEGIKIMVVETFIALLKEHPAIWSLRHPQHKDLNVVRNSWESIKRHLEESFPVEVLHTCKMEAMSELKQKFHNLKTTLSRERNKAKGKSGASLEEVSGTIWMWSSHLQFLNRENEIENFGTSSLSLSSFPGTVSLDPQSEIFPKLLTKPILQPTSEDSYSDSRSLALNELEADKLIGNYNVNTEDAHLTLSPESEDDQGPNNYVNPSPPTSKPWTPRPKKRNVSKSDEKDLSFQKACEAFAQRCQKVTQEDDTSSFLQFIGVKLRSLDKKKRFAIQLKIMEHFKED
jgi:hypothetical protein